MKFEIEGQIETEKTVKLSLVKGSDGYVELKINGFSILFFCTDGGIERYNMNSWPESLEELKKIGFLFNDGFIVIGNG